MLSRYGARIGTVTLSKVVTGTRTVTCRKSEPEPFKKIFYGSATLTRTWNQQEFQAIGLVWHYTLLCGVVDPDRLKCGSRTSFFNLHTDLDPDTGCQPDPI